MAIEPTEWIWSDGQWLRWEDATVHVSAHVLHYGSSVFEGIRAYDRPDGPAIFRLDCHIRRLLNSCKLLRLPVAFSAAELREVCLDTIARNGLRSGYVRPLVFRESGSMLVDGWSCPARVVIFAFPWASYLGQEAHERGVEARVSSWRRFAGDSMLPLGKIGGQYINNQLVSAEARIDGYGEGIALDGQGMVAEGGAENLFMVEAGALVTPPLETGILGGITRDTVATLAGDLGIPVREARFGRDRLYLADEVLMTGTAAEITPVISVDRLPIGEGKPGPVTRRLQAAFFGLVRGELPDAHGWMTPVPEAVTSAGR